MTKTLHILTVYDCGSEHATYWMQDLKAQDDHDERGWPCRITRVWWEGDPADADEVVRRLVDGAAKPRPPGASTDNGPAAGG